MLLILESNKKGLGVAATFSAISVQHAVLPAGLPKIVPVAVYFCFK
jgi:hypothetical protein